MNDRIGILSSRIRILSSRTGILSSRIGILSNLTGLPAWLNPEIEQYKIPEIPSLTKKQHFYAETFFGCGGTNDNSTQ